MRRAENITLFSIAGIYFFSMFHRVAVPGTLFNEFQESFNASASEVAVLGAIYLYIYGAMQISAGMLSDRIGSSKTLIAGGVLLSAGSLAFPFPAAIGPVYASRALIGLGAGLIYISMLKHIKTYFPAGDFTFVLGIGMAAGYSGGLAGTYPLERAAANLGWQAPFFIAGVMCLMLVIFMAFRLRRRLFCVDCDFSFRTLNGVFKNRAVIPVICSGSIVFAVYFMIQATIGKKMLEDIAGLSSSGGALFTSFMIISVMASILFHGYMGRRTRRRKPFVLASSAALLAGVSLILVNIRFLGSLPLFFFSYFLCAWAGGGNIINPALMTELNSKNASGTAVGLYNSVMFLAVGAAGHGAGVIMDIFKEGNAAGDNAVIYPAEAYSMIFSLCVVLGMISLAAAFAVRENRAETAGS